MLSATPIAGDGGSDHATGADQDRESIREEAVMELVFAFLAIVLFIGLWLQT